MLMSEIIIREAGNRMNERCKKVSASELTQEMEYLSNIYDIVRIVDPANTAVVQFSEGKMIETKKEPCFSVWEKKDRCCNCISNQACTEMKRVTKFEFRGDEAYYVLSVPYVVSDRDIEKVVALELVNRVSDDFQLHSHEKDQTSDLVRAISLQNYVDSLTGTLNRKYFDEKRYLYDHIENFPRRIGFLMLDVNQFQEINDVYGHIHGDELLAKVGEVLRRSFRNTDKIIRLGGDEFLIVIRDCSELFMEDKITLVKHSVSDIRFDWMGERRASVAIGMSYTDSFIGKKDQIEELYQKADEEMYRDKMAPLPETSEKTILIVDDIVMNRDFIKIELKNKFHLLEAENGEDALVILKTNHVDLIITDIFMDHMNGYELMKKVRDNPNTKNIPIIAITENTESSQSKAIASGADIYIDRPAKKELLVKSIMQLTGHDHGRRELFNMDFVLDSIPGAVLVCKFVDDLPEVLYCSRGIHNIVDAESDEFGYILGEKGHEIIYPTDRPKFMECIHRIINTKSRGEIIFRSYNQDGSIVWLWLQARYIGEEEGYPIIEEIVLNVSNSTGMYENLLDEASSLITVIDCNDHEILYANKKAKQELSEPIGAKCHSVFFQKELPCDDCEMSSEVCGQHEKNWIHNGRTYRQIIKRILWNGRYALLKCMEDITEQKRLQKYVEVEKDNLKQIVQNVPAGLFVFKFDKNANIEIVEANPSAFKLMGIDPDKTIGSGTKEVFELTHPDDRKIISDVIAKMRVPGADIPYEYRQYNKEKKEYFWMSARAHSVLDTDGNILIYISYFNITEQKKARELQENLRIAQIESKEKTKFMSNMSHDMRTPLNGMLGLAYLMTEKTDIDELHRDAKQLVVSGNLLLSLINDTLDISKIESGKFKLNEKPVNSGMIFENVLTTVELFAQNSGINLEYYFPNIPRDKWVPVVTDSSRVEQILINVITNAIKYSKEGGTVELHMENLSIENGIVTDKYTIVDHGIGMSEEFLPHVFEPFIQEGRKTSVSAQGTGLGMSIVKQLVDLMGGKISIESEVDVGTTVSIIMRYPVYEGKLLEDNSKTLAKVDLNGIRVLLCEDHPLNRQIMTMILKKQGIIVDSAENGKQGLEMFMHSEPYFYQAVLMDIRMPVMDGITAAKAIRSLDKKDAKTIPIIAMTANAFAEDKEETKKAGMNAHLAKPVEPDKLFDTLKEFCRKIDK